MSIAKDIQDNPQSAALRAAEDRGYARGYKAGRNRVKRDISNEQNEVKKNALWQRYMTAALGSSLTVDGWTVGNSPINTLDDRVKLAKKFADEALCTTIAHGRL